MTHRIISYDYTHHVVAHIRECGCICRTHTTTYRGPLAIIGEGRVWAVAELREVKPVVTQIPKKGEDPEPASRFLWCFEDLCEVEAIPCANIESPAMFDNQGSWEPLYLQASAQTALSRILQAETGQEQLEMASRVSVHTQEPETPELASSGATGGQLELFS
ncbi:hypothetical protein IAD21_00593 [Abditibacteriota bacterium]|nr:hypothetical protein IAD21_00593 [Abditibacteriota bacterium]